MLSMPITFLLFFVFMAFLIGVSIGAGFGDKKPRRIVIGECLYYLLLSLLMTVALIIHTNASSP